MPLPRCRCRSRAIQRFLNGRRDGLDFGAQLLLDAVPAPQSAGALIPRLLDACWTHTGIEYQIGNSLA